MINRHSIYNMYISLQFIVVRFCAQLETENLIFLAYFSKRHTSCHLFYIFSLFCVCWETFYFSFIYVFFFASRFSVLYFFQSLMIFSCCYFGFYWIFVSTPLFLDIFVLCHNIVFMPITIKTDLELYFSKTENWIKILHSHP